MSERTEGFGKVEGLGTVGMLETAEDSGSVKEHQWGWWVLCPTRRRIAVISIVGAPSGPSKNEMSFVDTVAVSIVLANMGKALPFPKAPRISCCR